MALVTFASHTEKLGVAQVLNADGSVASESKKSVDIFYKGQKVSKGNPGPPYRTGGNFLIRKVVPTTSPSASMTVSSNGTGSKFAVYNGKFIPNILYDGTGDSITNLDLNTESWGSTGFARSRPDNPTASVGQFLIELRDLPKIPLQRLKHFRDLGSEYLNVVFGWKPFVEDLQKMYETYSNVRAHLEKLVARRNKPIKRRLTLGETSSSSTSSVSSTFGGTYLFPSSGTVTANSTKVTEIAINQDYRFSGTFKYWMPDLEPDRWPIKATLALYGALPTPKLLWDVIPWTWLIGWCSNIGDALANLSSHAIDNLVADHAYITGKYQKMTRTTVTGAVAKIGGGLQPITCSATVTETVLHRLVASPYGFGIHSASLDPGRIAILAALGISRIF